MQRLKKNLLNRKHHSNPPTRDTSMQSLQQFSDINATVAKSKQHQNCENSSEDDVTSQSSSAPHIFKNSNYEPIDDQHPHESHSSDHNLDSSSSSTKIQRGLFWIMRNKQRKLALFLGLQKRSSSNQSLQKAAIAGATITSMIPAVGSTYLPDKEQIKQISASDQQLSSQQKHSTSSTSSTPIHSTMSSPSCSLRMKKRSAKQKYTASKCYNPRHDYVPHTTDSKYQSKMTNFHPKDDTFDYQQNNKTKKPKTNMALNVLHYLLQVPGYNQQQTVSEDKSEGSLSRRIRSVSYDEMRLKQEIGNENGSWHSAATKTISDQSSKRSDFNNNNLISLECQRNNKNSINNQNKNVPETDKEEINSRMIDNIQIVNTNIILNTTVAISNVITTKLTCATSILADPSVIGSLLVKEQQMSKKKRKSDLRLNLTTLDITQGRNRSRSFDDRTSGLIGSNVLNRSNINQQLLSPSASKSGLDMIKKRSGSISALQIPKWKLFVRRSSSSSSGRASLSASALNLSSPTPLDRCVHCNLIAEQKTVEYLVKTQRDTQKRNSLGGYSDSSKRSSLDTSSLNNEKVAQSVDNETDEETANSSPLKSRKSGAMDKRMMKFHEQASRSYSSHTPNSEECDDCCLISPEIGLPLVTLSIAQDNKVPIQTVNVCSNADCPFFDRVKLCSNLNCPNLFTDQQDKSQDSTPSTASTTIATSETKGSDEKEEKNVNKDDNQIKDQIADEESNLNSTKNTTSPNVCATANLLSPLSASSLNTINNKACKESRIFTFSSIETAASSANQTPSSSTCSNLSCPNWPIVVCETRNAQANCPNKLRLMQKTLAQVGDEACTQNAAASSNNNNNNSLNSTLTIQEGEELNDGQTVTVVSLEVPVIKQSRSASIDASFLQVPQQLLRKNQTLNYSTSELDDEEDDQQSITCKTQRSHSVDIQLPIKPDGQYFILQTNSNKATPVFKKYVFDKC